MSRSDCASVGRRPVSFDVEVSCREASPSRRLQDVSRSGIALPKTTLYDTARVHKAPPVLRSVTGTRLQNGDPRRRRHGDPNAILGSLPKVLRVPQVVPCVVKCVCSVTERSHANTTGYRNTRTSAFFSFWSIKQASGVPMVYRVGALDMAQVAGRCGSLDSGQEMRRCVFLW